MAEYDIDPLTGDPIPKNNRNERQEIPPAKGLPMPLELFCKAYVSSGDSFAAWKVAFTANGSKDEVKALLSQPNVIARVQFLSEERLELMTTSPDVNIDLLVRKLELARKLAMKNEEPQAAIAAVMAMGKLHGLLVDKKEMSFKRPEDMTEAEIMQALGITSIDELEAIEHQSLPKDDETIN